jgi:hypothetical protein
MGLLVLAPAGATTIPTGIGKMSVTPNRVVAGTQTDLTFTYVADSAALNGTLLLDAPRGWSKPQQTNPSAPGYVELQASGCTGSRIARIADRRIVIAAKCPRRHLFHLVYHRASVPLISADGYDFLTQTRPTAAPRKTPFKPLGWRKQPVVRVRGAAASGLFIAMTNIAASGVQFSALVRAVDRFGNNAADYTGMVTLTSTDPAATLPPPYAYGPIDASQHTFGVVLRTAGTQTITATDSHGFTIQSAPITVAPASG